MSIADFVLHLKLEKLEKQIEFIKRARKTPNPYEASSQDVQRLETEVACMRAYLHAIMRALVEKGIATEAELDRFAAEALNPPQAELDKPDNSGQEAAQAAFKELGL
jgi:hypothetical protein